MEITAIRAHLEGLKDPHLAQFSSGLLPGLTRPILGVRTPQLRTFAKTLAKTDWRDTLVELTAETYEELLLEGLIIAYAATTREERFALVSGFVPKIDNWAVCDTFCNSLKSFRRYGSAGWEFVLPYIRSSVVYEQRFGIVMGLSHYVTADYIDAFLAEISALRPLGHYGAMAAGWALCECFVKFPGQTYPLLIDGKLPLASLKKARQKILESLRPSAAWKARIRSIAIT